ncbi:MAG: BRO family protein [Propionibacteriaceae bacterium]|nr:BRO family protein [Propionibacteriaceae bacterium]
MSDLVLFSYQDQEIRVLSVNGEPWFVLADLCKMLDLSNPSMVAERLDSDALSAAEVIDSMGRKQRARIVSEPGMYQAAFMSRKPEAAAFRRWVTHEVLPSIRKRGGYLTPEAAERAEHQLNAAIRRAQMQMELCQAAKGIIHPDHLEARARIVLARGLDERPVLDEARKPLYTQDFLREKNLSSKRLRSVAGVFGKRAKAAYIERYGVAPEKYHLNLPNGQVREVYGYTEADRPMLEAVWAAFESAPRLEVLA